MRKDNANQLFEKLNEFIKKYYQNQLIKGGIYVISILIIFFLLFAIIEYFSSFGVGGRTFLFWTYILLNLIVFGKLLVIPTNGWMGIHIQEVIVPQRTLIPPPMAVTV